MTLDAHAAWMELRTHWDNLIESLTPEEWLAPTACPGWRVRDMVAHLAASARGVIDPVPEPADAPPLPADRERVHDVMVARRADWTIDEVVQEYRTYGEKLAELVLGFQSEPIASSTMELPGLGVYPLHLGANASTFDYYCHLYHDVASPRGPLERDLPEPDHRTLYAALEWMMAGLPQMQGSELDDTVAEPITFRFTGPGESEWTLSRPDRENGLVVEETAGGAVVVTSTADSFVCWGTQRADWRQHCAIAGSESLAIPLLDALNII